MNWHMRNVIMVDKNDVEDCHLNFEVLRLDQEMELAFMTEANFIKTVNHEISTHERTFRSIT